MFSCNPELEIEYECTQFNCIFYMMYLICIVLYCILLHFGIKEIV